MSKNHATYRPRKRTNTQWVECECGKRSFSSRDAARRGLAKAHNKIRVYICPVSGKWHATSQLEAYEEYDEYE